MYFNLRKPLLIAGISLALTSIKTVASIVDVTENVYVQGFAGYASNNFSSLFTDAELVNMAINKGSLTYGASIGYQINPRWRADISYTGNSKNKITLTPTGQSLLLPVTTTTTTSTVTPTTAATVGGGTINLLMLNGYFDFADVNYGLAPYATLGAGFGLIGNIQDFQVGADANNPTYIALNTRVSSMHKFAYQLGGGVLYKFNHDLVIDAGVRYVNVATKNIVGFNSTNYTNMTFQIGVRFHF